MSKAKREIVYPKKEEDSAIRAGIASDPDTREFTSEETARMRQASEVVPHIVERYRRTRGKQKAPKKMHISIHLDADLAAHFHAAASGLWRFRMSR